MNIKVSYEDGLRVTVLEVDSTDAESVEAAKEAVASAISSTAPQTATREELPEMLFSKWHAIPSIVRPVLSPVSPAWLKCVPGGSLGLTLQRTIVAVLDFPSSDTEGVHS